METNRKSGIIISSRALVLQKVSKRTAGIYKCSAENEQGQGESQPFHLSIKCKLYHL